MNLRWLAIHTKTEAEPTELFLQFQLADGTWVNVPTLELRRLADGSMEAVEPISEKRPKQFLPGESIEWKPMGAVEWRPGMYLKAGGTPGTHQLADLLTGEHGEVGSGRIRRQKPGVVT